MGYWKNRLPASLYNTLLKIRIDFFADYVKSYSFDGEDLILNRIFANKKNGFYVDVGAYHPKRVSNTLLFYKKGWNGINIEPNPELIKTFNRFRKRDINVSIGISEKEGTFDYYMFEDPPYNTFSHELYQERIKNNVPFKGKQNIATMPLEKALDIHLRNREIDFINIDVEGRDMDVLKSNNWNKYRPKVVLAEIISSNLQGIIDHEMTKYMLSQNYILYAKTINTIFYLEKDFFKTRHKLTENH